MKDSKPFDWDKKPSWWPKPSRLKCTKCKGKNLEVWQRLCNFSAFSGYHYTPSDYSLLRCCDCGRMWRTKADVSHLPNSKKDRGRSGLWT